MTGMRRQKPELSLPAGGMLHPLPEAHRLSGIIARLRCQENADIVCLRFMRAAEGEQDAHVGAEAEGVEVTSYTSGACGGPGSLLTCTPTWATCSSVGSERHLVPRRPGASAALRLPAPFLRGSGAPCQRPPAWRACVLGPHGPTTRAPAYASCAGDPAPALRHTGVSARRGTGLPGYWSVLCVRDLVAHSAGYTSPPRPE